MEAQESRRVAWKGAPEVTSSSLLLEAGLQPALKQVSCDFCLARWWKRPRTEIPQLLWAARSVLYYPTSDAFPHWPSKMGCCCLLCHVAPWRRFWLRYLGKYSLSGFRWLLDHSALTFPGYVSSTKPCAKEHPQRRWARWWETGHGLGCVSLLLLRWHRSCCVSAAVMAFTAKGTSWQDCVPRKEGAEL